MVEDGGNLAAEERRVIMVTVVKAVSDSRAERTEGPR